MPKKGGQSCVASIIGVVVFLGLFGLIYGTFFVRGSFVGSPLFMVCLMIAVVGLPIAIIVTNADKKSKERQYKKALNKAKICPQCGRENALTLNEEVIDRRPKYEKSGYYHPPKLSDDFDTSPPPEIITTEITKRCKFCNWSYRKTSETIR